MSAGDPSTLGSNAVADTQDAVCTSSQDTTSTTPFTNTFVYWCDVCGDVMVAANTANDRCDSCVAAGFAPVTDDELSQKTIQPATVSPPTQQSDLPCSGVHGVTARKRTLSCIACGDVSPTTPPQGSPATETVQARSLKGPRQCYTRCGKFRRIMQDMDNALDDESCTPARSDCTTHASATPDGITSRLFPGLMSGFTELNLDDSDDDATTEQFN